MRENQLFLKQFFKSNNSKMPDFNNMGKQISKKIEPYRKEIEKNIETMGGCDLLEPDTFDIKCIYEEYQNLWGKSQTLQETKLKEIKKYLLILFPNPNEGVPKGLYDSPEQFDDLLKTLIQKNSQTCLRKLFSYMLYYYPKDKYLYKRLQKIYDSLDHKRRSNVHLIQANRKFQLTKEKTPYTIAQSILNAKNFSAEILPYLWLNERHLSSNGIGQSIVNELCHLMKKYINDLSKKDIPIKTQEENMHKLDCFLKYLSAEDNIQSSLKNNNMVYFNNSEHTVKNQPENNNRGRFTNPIPIVSALLLPFEENPPIQKIKTKITKFLDCYIGDPRIKPMQWRDPRIKKERSIFLKWKIGETLKDFFDLLSYTASQDPDADRMWPHRKEFIKSYWKKGHIKDAWIVLGKEDYKNRTKFLKENFNDYGKIVKGANSKHSVLLFQIGDLILSEWNYNGKLRVWNRLNQNCPKFYNEQYSRESLIKNPDKEFIHHFFESNKYYWQKQVSIYIKDYTGIVCPENIQNKINKC